MARLSIADLQNVRDRNKATFTLRKGEYKAKIVVHMGTCGIAAGARNIMTVLMKEIALSGREDTVVKTTGCGGLCAREPMAMIELVDQTPVIYGNLNEEKITEIFRKHVMHGNPVEKYALALGGETFI
ncbi:MAG: (2Fe-2S) ferredoxin domain-containing protein [Nitrospiraceae bacterium]|nr:MAG: (2Fe-2S) ferredoxin domain-containing protein [Nitrospiraceae bacterium]